MTTIARMTVTREGDTYTLHGGAPSGGWKRELTEEEFDLFMDLFSRFARSKGPIRYPWAKNAA